jgi:homogentisate 1,2-dioxygenase
LYYEQLFGTEGFSGTSSLLYHTHLPTKIKKQLESYSVAPKIVIEKNILPRKLESLELTSTDDYLESRTVLLANNSVQIAIASPKKSMTAYFYKNTQADELLFVHKGSGVLRTLMGNIVFEPGDYLIIPKGIIYQLRFNNANNKILIVESNSPIYTPKRYKNNFGQFSEHSPFCERDIRVPEQLETFDKEGDFLIKIKKQDTIHQLVYASHPFDVVGWDGNNYPYAFSIHNFEPITGRIHQPPPIHQTFETNHFVICSFCPRMYDYHPEAIPAPYNHSNIDSDEVLYYVNNSFMSRGDINEGQITLHPGGIPHGPHPGAIEKSIGKKETLELAVMIDTFEPLMLTEEALQINVPNYYTSWYK